MVLYSASQVRSSPVPAIANAAHGVRLAAVGIQAEIAFANNVAVAGVIGRVGGTVDSPVGEAASDIGGFIIPFLTIRSL